MVPMNNFVCLLVTDLFKLALLLLRENFSTCGIKISAAPHLVGITRSKRKAAPHCDFNAHVALYCGATAQNSSW